MKDDMGRRMQKKETYFIFFLFISHDCEIECLPDRMVMPDAIHGQAVVRCDTGEAAEF
jgi:hypothetical protein